MARLTYSVNSDFASSRQTGIYPFIYFFLLETINLTTASVTPKVIPKVNPHSNSLIDITSK